MFRILSKKYNSKIISVLLIVFVVVNQFSGISAYAAGNGIVGVNDISTFEGYKTGELTPVIIDDDVTITSSDGFSDGYLLIKNTAASHSDDVMSIISDSNPNNYNALSLDNGIVYLGNGNGKESIGTIDKTYNGNGTDLKINFSMPLNNGDFDNGEENWTLYDEFLELKGDSKIDTDTWFSVGDYSEAWIENNIFGNSYIRMKILTTIEDAYGTLHGPYVESSGFEAVTGDFVSLDFYAENTGDKFDVYGYLIDNNTQAEQLLFYQRGEETDGWESINAPITLADSNNFSFKFICGSQDGTGGKVIGSELLIDNVRLNSSLISDRIVTNIARKVALVSVSQDTRTLTSDRKYSFETEDVNGNIMISGTTATVKIETFPMSPNLSVISRNGTTDTLDVTWNDKEGGESFDLYLEDVKKLDDTKELSKTFTKLDANRKYTIGISASNKYGESLITSISTYTNAAVPTLQLDKSNSYEIDFIISNNENSANTAYRLERSLDNSNYTVVEDFTLSSSSGETTDYTDIGLLPNTKYYYRIKARNEDNKETEYSSMVSRLTAPEPVDPISVEVITNTHDSLDITWQSVAQAVDYSVYRDNVKINENLEVLNITHEGLQANTPYDVYVVSTNGTDESSKSQIISRYTGAADLNLVLDSATETEIAMTISNNTNAADTKYKFERSIDNIQWEIFENYTILSDGTNSQLLNITGLTPGTSYYVRGKAINEEGIESNYSNVVSRITLPVAVTGLTVNPKEVFDDILVLSWTVPKGADNFDVYRKANGENTFTKIYEAYEGSQLEDTGLTPNRSYTYYVVAKNASGEAAKSIEVTNYTYAAIPGISSENSGNTNNLTIETNENPEVLSVANALGTEYMIEYSTDDGDSWTELRDWIKFLTPQHQNIENGLTYLYRVKARNTNLEETVFSGTSSARSNEEPIILITSPNENIYRSAEEGYTTITISGQVYDADGDTVKLSATIDGNTKIKYINATPGGVNWSLNFDVLEDNISESNYSSIAIQGNDGYGGITTRNSEYIIFVDRTAPLMPTIVGNTNWTNESTVLMSIIDGADAVAGVKETEYKVSGATTKEWSKYLGTNIVINNEGETTIHARTIDQVGNIGEIQTAIVKIDRTAPIIESFDICSKDGIVGYSNSRVTDIKNIESSGSPAKIQVSNVNDFTEAIWIDYGNNITNWSVTEGIGEKTVYIRLKDAVGNIGNAVMATLDYNNIIPEIEISNPSKFNAKKGTTINYTISVDKASTFSGVNIGDSGKIELSSMGTFTSEELNAIRNNLDIVEIDALTRQLNINLPSNMTGEGTIGIKVLGEAATDSYGNKSLLSISTGSFVVDAVSPINQNLLFGDDLTIKGGQAVYLLRSSESCDGGADSDSVRFAEAGYNGVNPANGTTITSTHGRSTVVNAPIETGEYYLYVIDAAGNISVPSTAKLTVKNIGPTLELSNPSESYVNAGASVDYIVTYSEDASSITLSEEDIALITTGTGNAYVDISTVNGEPLQRKITLRNLMGEGTVKIAIAKGSGKDIYNNLSMALDNSNPVKIDNTPANVSDIEWFSDNEVNLQVVTTNHVVKLGFTTDEPITVATVKINNEVVVATSNGDKTVWAAEYTIPENHGLVEGEPIEFTIVTTDNAGNSSDVVNQTLAIKDIISDFTSPIITIEGEKDALGRYKDSGIISLNEGTGVLTNTNTGVTMGITSSTTIYNEGSYSVVATDDVGLTSQDTFVISYSQSIIELEKENLKIGYVDGDNKDSIKNNVVLTTTGSVGSNINWSSTSASIKTDGDITRPANSSGNDIVTLTATLSRDGLTETKEFVVTVIEEADNNLGLAKVIDDADSARIMYSFGDDIDNVTKAIKLSDIGSINNSSLTWESNNTDVITIENTASNNWFNTEVIRPQEGEEDAIVTLTVISTDTNDSEKIWSKEILLTVKAIKLTDAEKAKADYNTVDITYAEGDDAEKVTQNVTFVSNIENGSTVTWSTNNSAYIDDIGVVTRPSMEEGSRETEITAIITNGTATLVKRFEITILKEYSPENDIQIDKENLEIGYYESDSADNVNTHVLLPVLGEKGSIVTWTSSKPEIIDENGIVTRKQSDQTVVLTANLVLGGEVATKEFILIVKESFEDDILRRIHEDTNDIRVIYQGTDNSDRVTTNIVLKESGANGSTIEWNSSDPLIVSTKGVVTRQEEDVPIQMTANIKQYSKSINFWINRVANFDVLIKGNDSRELAADLDEIDIVYSEGDNEENVTATMYFPRIGVTGTTVTWESMNLDYVSHTGRVTRPIVSDKDRRVIIIATLTQPMTGETKTKTFDVLIKKMTEKEAVEDAAKKLTTDKAFKFENENDIWEAITADFWRVTSFVYNTKITWESSDSSVIDLTQTVADSNSKKAEVKRLETEDRNIILTATITLGSSVTTKTYLLIVKSEAATKDTIREELFDIQLKAGEESGNDNLKVYRTIVNEDEVKIKIDTVIIDPTEVQAQTELINPMGTEVDRTMSVLFVKDATNLADEQAIEIPAMSVQYMSERNMLLRIETPTADIVIKEEQLRKVKETGNDLYFRVLPINDVDNRSELSNSAIISLGSNAIAVGVPCTIETNYKGVDTYITIPFGDAEITNYNDLYVYINHSDNTTETKTGTVIYRNGIPYGLEFIISHFSDFQLMEKPKASNTGGNGDIVVFKKKVEEEGYELVGTPIIVVFDEKKYKEIFIPIIEGQKITTGIRLNEDGTIMHIPTEVVIMEGMYFAKLNALVGGVFGLIWNPVEMDDVENYWGKEYINNMYSRLVIKGVSKDIYEPERNMTRGEFAAIMVRGLGLILEYGESIYKDVLEDTWYNKYVNTATTYELIEGYGDGNYGPKDYITREQAMVIINNTMEMVGLSVAYSEKELDNILSNYIDSEMLSSYAKDSVAICIKAGIVIGDSNNKLTPREYISRGEVATIITRLLRQSGMIDK